jgi:hypothetical protein
VTPAERRAAQDVEQPSLFEGHDFERYHRAVAACSDEDRAAWAELARWARGERRGQP